MKMQHLIVLLTLASCANQTTSSAPSTSPSATSPVSNPTTASPTDAPASATVWRAPKLKLPSNPGSKFIEAARIFADHINSDQFYTYLRSYVKKPLAGGNETDLEAAIAKYRKCLNESAEITVEWGWYRWGSPAIGGWNGYAIKQNPRYGLTTVERAGHWVHEIAHKCGSNHGISIKGKIVEQNNLESYPIMRESWPYQVGYAFEDYVTLKFSVAGAQ